MSFKWHNVKKGFEIDIDNENRPPREYEIPALTVGLEQEFIIRRKPFDECCEETAGLYRSIREIPERSGRAPVELLGCTAGCVQGCLRSLIRRDHLNATLRIDQ